MAIWKNTASQKLAVLAWDMVADTGKTGDAANISAQISKDGAATAATNDVAPTELDATDAPGVYIFDLAQAETNADLVVVAPVSSTANIKIETVFIYTATPVQTECTASLVTANLDHLCQTATVAADMTAEVADNTIVSRILAAGDTSAFVPSTDGLQLVRDKLTDIETDTGEIGTAGAGLSDLGGMSTAMKAEVEAECLDAMEGIELDHLMAVACGSNDITNNVVDQSALAALLAADGDISAYNDNVASLEAIATLGVALTTATMNSAADALLDRTNGIETDFTLRQAIRLVLAALVGKLSGAGSASVAIRDINDTTDRITAAVEEVGNRTSVTTDVT